MEPRFKVGDKVRTIKRVSAEDRCRLLFVDDIVSLAGNILDFTPEKKHYQLNFSV